MCQILRFKLISKYIQACNELKNEKTGLEIAQSYKWLMELNWESRSSPITNWFPSVPNIQLIHNDLDL